MENKSANSLISFLESHASENCVSFHMPGHKGEKIFDEFGYGDLIRNLVSMDVTEIHGADNLFQPETVINSIMERYATYYGAKKTFLSIGGSSAGLIASILAVVQEASSKLSASQKPRLLIARNSHKSIYNAVRLAGAEAEYIYPETVAMSDMSCSMDDKCESGFAGAISPDAIREAFRLSAINHGKSGVPCAVVIPSPNYYGIMSDIKTIADICHEHGALLIVDQAHGAHLSLLSKNSLESRCATSGGAEDCGADIVVSSTHKTLTSFTQSAIVNVCSDRVSVPTLADRLQMIQSSSPSYILMVSLEMNIDILEKHGGELADRWMENLDYFYNEASKIEGLSVFDLSFKCDNCDESIRPIIHDRTKILISMQDLGYSGFELEEALRKRGVYMELSDANIAMGLTGIGNIRSDYERLISALNDIGKMPNTKEVGHDKKLGGSLTADERDRILGKSGTIAQTSIIPYPPGIPLIVEGEVIVREALLDVIRLREIGSKVIGFESLLEV